MGNMLMKFLKLIRGELMDEELFAMLDKYSEKFNDNYPLMQLAETKAETIAHIKECLRTGKKVKVEDGKDILY